MDSCMKENAIKPQSLTGKEDLDRSDVFKHYLNGREEAIQDADGQAEGLWIKLQLGMHIPQPPDGLITLFRGNICILKNENTQSNSKQPRLVKSKSNLFLQTTRLDSDVQIFIQKYYYLKLNENLSLFTIKLPQFPSDAMSHMRVTDTNTPYSHNRQQYLEIKQPHKTASQCLCVSTKIYKANHKNILQHLKRLVHFRI